VIGVHRCSLVVDGREVAVFAEATVVGAEVGLPERPSAATVTLRGGALPDWPAAGRSCFLVLYAATGAPLAKYWLAKARPTAATVLTCDYIEEMAP
jgi:hypothetical protein